MNIKKIIKESLLNEIGEGTAVPYEWRLDYETDSIVTYEFKTKGGSKIKMSVTFHLVYPYNIFQLVGAAPKRMTSKIEEVVSHPYYYWDVELTAVERKGIPIEDPIITISKSQFKTDKTEIFRIMSTLIEIIDDLMKRKKVRGLVFKPATDSRSRIFQKYLEKQLPESDIIKLPEGGTFVTINKSVRYEANDETYDYTGLENSSDKVFFNKFKE